MLNGKTGGNITIFNEDDVEANLACEPRNLYYRQCVSECGLPGNLGGASWSVRRLCRRRGFAFRRPALALHRDRLPCGTPFPPLALPPPPLRTPKCTLFSPPPSTLTFLSQFFLSPPLSVHTELTGALIGLAVTAVILGTTCCTFLLGCCKCCNNKEDDSRWGMCNRFCPWMPCSDPPEKERDVPSWMNAPVSDEENKSSLFGRNPMLNAQVSGPFFVELPFCAAAELSCAL